MREHNKTNLAQIFNDADTAFRKMYDEGAKDTFRWFVDKMREHKIDTEIQKQILMAFVVEHVSFPSREELTKHYEEYLSNLGKQV